ncbi:MAG: MoaD/ThiS family protein [Promethearchaeota archaeon]|nr:MAG: MoaD/ThiS family protein [Candidatus Lokiarchaeota archaeon]
MADVKLKLMTIFSTDVGVSEIDYSGVDRLADVISLFINEHGNKIRKSFINPEGKLESHVVILVNGRNYLFLDDLNTKLKDGDQIVISPPLVGG